MSDPLTDQERTQVQSLLGAPLLFPKEFKTWVVDNFAVNVPLIPFDQILGSRLNIAKSGGFIATREQVPNGASYGDCATVGPQIVGIADGIYVVAWGAAIDASADSVWFGINVNGTDPTDANSPQTSPNLSGFIQPMSRARLITLKNDNNSTITVKYRASGGTAKYARNRWLAIIRVATA